MDQLFLCFLTEHDPFKGPFLKKLDFGGDPKIVISGTEATLLSAENSINPRIKTTLGPTSSIWEGSGRGCFFDGFLVGEKTIKNRWMFALRRFRGEKGPTTLR